MVAPHIKRRRLAAQRANEVKVKANLAAAAAKDDEAAAERKANFLKKA